MEEHFSLDKLLSGQSAKILDIAGGWGIRQRLLQVGIHVGDIILMKRCATMGGPILLSINHSEIAISRGMARHIKVGKLEL
jgi:Fe2+ transport system protein FeoA